MRYILSRSLQLIISMIIIGLLITLCLSNFIESFKMANIPANGLTNSYYTFSIGEYKDKITKDKIILSDMLTFLETQKSKLILLKESDSKVFGVYSLGYTFSPNILSGRTFTKDDFEKKTNTIIVSESMQDKCIEIDGKRFYEFDANYFEVIGIFKPSDNLINKDAIAYYNLSSSQLKSKNIIYDNYIFGRYQIDAGDKTLEIINQLNNYCTVKVSRSSTDNNFLERLQKTISSQGLTLFPIILIIILILLNSVNLSSNWIENRRKEIFVRRLVGATDRKISIMLLRDFFIVISMSYIIVLLISMMIHKIDLVILLNFKFSPETIFISYTTTLLVGLISAGLMMITYRKNSISQIRG